MGHCHVDGGAESVLPTPLRPSLPSAVSSVLGTSLPGQDGGYRRQALQEEQAVGRAGSVCIFTAMPARDRVCTRTAHAGACGLAPPPCPCSREASPRCRQTLKQKYKVLRKVKEHHRKKRRADKKLGIKPKEPMDPGIPNAWPFKEELIAQLKAQKERAVAKEQMLREQRKAQRQQQVRRRGAGGSMSAHITHAVRTWTAHGRRRPPPPLPPPRGLERSGRSLCLGPPCPPGRHGAGR